MKKGKWTKEEEEFLKENCQICTREELAESLGRNYDSVCHKLSSMGLSNKTKSERIFWTNENLKLLKDILHLYTKKELAEFFGVTEDSIYRQIRKNGLIQKEEIDIPEGYKKCNECKKILLKDSFGIHRFDKDGLRGDCKECWNFKCMEWKLKKKLSFEKERKEQFIKENQHYFFQCKKCGQVKPFNDFHVVKGKKFRLSTECKKCHNERAKKNRIKRIKEKGYD